MDIKSFIELIVAEFDNVDLAAITPQSNYKDTLNLNSINSLILIAVVDAAFNVALDANDLKTTQSFNELFELINTRIS